jgi:hypothetical protein
LFTNEDSLFNAINELGDFSVTPFLQSVVAISDSQKAENTAATVENVSKVELPPQHILPPPPQKLPEGDLSLLAAGICFESDSLFLPLSGALGKDVASRLFFSRQGGKSCTTRPTVAINETKQQQTVNINPSPAAATAPVRIFDFIRNSSAGRLSPMMTVPSVSSSSSGETLHLSASRQAVLSVRSDSLPPLHVANLSSSSSKNRIAPTLLMRSQSDGLASGVFQRFGSSYQQSMVRPAFQSSVSPATVAAPISDSEEQPQKARQNEICIEDKNEEEMIVNKRQGETAAAESSAAAVVVTESESENVKPMVVVESAKSSVGSLKRKNSGTSADASAGGGSAKKGKPPQSTNSRSPAFLFHNSQYHVHQQQQVQDSEDSMDAIAAADYPRRAALFRQTLAGRVAACPSGASHNQRAGAGATDFARLLSREGRSRPDLRRISPSFVGPLGCCRDPFLLSAR